MYLGIEIGGTKLQFGVGPGDGTTFVDFVRCDVDPARAAEGIRSQIQSVGKRLVAEHRIQRVGYGFGGPVFGSRGLVQTSHQVAGWDQFPLVEWTQQELGVATRLGNDCDVAALAEATNGAGRDARTVFYITVGTGIGGGLVIDRRIHGTDRPAAAEIGHLRPGLAAMTTHQTIESDAAGPAISRRVQIRLHEILESGFNDPHAHALLALADGRIEKITTKHIAMAAQSGNPIAVHSYHEATTVLGWGIAQMITLLAPDVVVVGGGVSLAGESVFFEPLRAAVEVYSFPPLKQSCPIVPAALGESVVVHGALALAAAP